MTLPLALLPALRQTFTAVDGAPLSNGSLAFFETGTSTPLPVYSDQDGTVLGVTVDLDDAGRTVNGMGDAIQVYVAASGYTVKVYNSDAVLQFTVQFVEDVGSASLAEQGAIATQGVFTSSSPYIVQAEDNMVVIQGATDPFTVQLPPAADRGTPLIIKNDSTGVVNIMEAGTETIDLETSPYVLPAKSGQTKPTVTLNPDRISAWYASGGIGI